MSPSDYPLLTAEVELSIRRAHSAEFRRLVRFRRLLTEACRAAIPETIELHSMRGRIKHIDSCIKKIESRRLRPHLDELGDLVGVRVVCLYRDDVEKVVAAIRAKLPECVPDESRPDVATQNSDGYRSVHLDGRISVDSIAGMDASPFQGRRFEVQVRTIVDDA